MFTSPLPPPLGGPPPAEVALRAAPLARVLAQVRFPTLLLIEDRAKVAPFQSDLRAAYPMFRQESGQSLRFSIGEGGPAFQAAPTTVWRFSDSDGSWSIVLGSEAITLETKAYVSRTEFIDRMGLVLGAVERHFAPGIAERIGLRYLTRIAGEAYERIEAMIPASLLGVAVPDLREHINHAISEAALSVEEGQLLMRWGFLPEQGTIDPMVLEPFAAKSWILDIDVSSGERRSFEEKALLAEFTALAKRAYSMFRHMVTPEFLALHGGKL